MRKNRRLRIASTLPDGNYGRARGRLVRPTDPDTVLSSPFALQGFQPIAGKSQLVNQFVPCDMSKRERDAFYDDAL